MARELNEAEREALTVQLERWLRNKGITVTTAVRQELRTLVDNLDTYIFGTVEPGANGQLPTKFQTGLDASQKYNVFFRIARERQRILYP